MSTRENIRLIARAPLLLKFVGFLFGPCFVQYLVSFLVLQSSL